eukprot:scaffold15929_cov159-Ochromonas_danica.AAC.11
MKSSPNRPPKPPKPARRRSKNPFVDDDEEDDDGITLTLSPVRVSPPRGTPTTAASGSSFVSTITRNPFVSTNPFDKETDLEAGQQQVELRFVSTNPFDGDDETTPSRSPGLIRSLTSSFRPSPSALPVKPAAPTPAPVRLPRFPGRHSGYDAFRSESATPSPPPAAEKQKREDSPDKVAARIASANQRQKFRQSMHRLEGKVDRSGEEASVHNVGEEGNVVVRFLLSKRVFGYPRSNGTFLSNYKHYVSVCRLGCNLIASSSNSSLANSSTALTSSIFSVPLFPERSMTFDLMEESSNSSSAQRCIGGYNDGLLYDSYHRQCQYYHDWLVSVVCGFFVVVYSSFLEFLVTCSCLQGRKTCQVYCLCRYGKQLVESCGGSTLIICTVTSTALMVYAILGSVLLNSDEKIIINILLSKAWAMVEWFAYSFPYFCLKYPTDRQHFYRTMKAKETRRSQRDESLVVSTS